MRVPIAVVFSAYALLSFAQLARAQAPASSSPSPSTLDAVKQRDQELEFLRSEQKKSEAAADALKAEIDALGEDRRRLNQMLIESAGRVRDVETRIALTEARLNPLDESERSINKSLERRQAVIAEVLAALQRMGRNPPPAIMSRPEDALETVRTAMMLGAVLPAMRTEAETLMADLAALARTRKGIAQEKQNLSADLDVVAQERTRLAALMAERQKRQNEVEKSLNDERQKAVALARQADNVKDLIAKLEQGLDSASRSARAAARADEQRPTDRGANLAALKDPGRLAPAISFAAAKGLLPGPVNGVKTRGFGDADGLGGTEKGVSIATRAGAQVTAPCDGWVVYAAPYRSYGQLLILNAGGGYHVVLAGMDRISVDVGQFVLTGEPIAVMGSGIQIASTAATSAGQPVLYIEFRKDGSPVDPGPWWATTDSEKVRG